MKYKLFRALINTYYFGNRSYYIYVLAEDSDEALEYIKDAIGLCLDVIVEKGDVPPKATKYEDIVLEKNQFLAVVSFDFDEYQKKHGNKSVKKTLTVPAWLNTLSERKNINFSQVLQNALIHELQIAE